MWVTSLRVLFMYLSFSPGFSPHCIHSQLHPHTMIWWMLPMLSHCFDFPTGSLISSSLLFCWWYFVGPGITVFPYWRVLAHLCWAILPFEIFILFVAFALIIIVIERRSGMLHLLQWCIQVVLVHVDRCKIFNIFLNQSINLQIS